MKRAAPFALALAIAMLAPGAAACGDGAAVNAPPFDVGPAHYHVENEGDLAAVTVRRGTDALLVLDWSSLREPGSTGGTRAATTRTAARRSPSTSAGAPAAAPARRRDRAGAASDHPHAGDPTIESFARDAGVL